MEQVHGTEKVFLELKNLSNPHHRRGLESEIKVIKNLQSQNWKLLAHRTKTIFAEIDLIFQQNKEILLIEVKSLNSEWSAFNRISQAQFLGLQKNQIYLQKHFRGFQVNAKVAWVLKNSISWVSLE